MADPAKDYYQQQLAAHTAWLAYQSHQTHPAPNYYLHAPIQPFHATHLPHPAQPQPPQPPQPPPGLSLAQSTAALITTTTTAASSAQYPPGGHPAKGVANLCDPYAYAAPSGYVPDFHHRPLPAHNTVAAVSRQQLSSVGPLPAHQRTAPYPPQHSSHPAPHADGYPPPQPSLSHSLHPYHHHQHLHPHQMPGYPPQYAHPVAHPHLAHHVVASQKPGLPNGGASSYYAGNGGHVMAKDLSSRGNADEPTSSSTTTTSSSQPMKPIYLGKSAQYPAPGDEGSPLLPPHGQTPLAGPPYLFPPYSHAHAQPPQHPYNFAPLYSTPPVSLHHHDQFHPGYPIPRQGTHYAAAPQPGGPAVPTSKASGELALPSVLCNSYDSARRHHHDLQPAIQHHRLHHQFTLPPATSSSSSCPQSTTSSPSALSLTTTPATTATVSVSLPALVSSSSQLPPPPPASSVITCASSASAVPAAEDPSEDLPLSMTKSRKRKSVFSSKCHSKEPKAKYFKKEEKKANAGPVAAAATAVVVSQAVSGGGGDDPYAFHEDDDKPVVSHCKENNANTDFTRFSRNSSTVSTSTVTGSSAYKFKKALLTRTAKGKCVSPVPSTSPPATTPIKVEPEEKPALSKPLAEHRAKMARSTKKSDHAKEEEEEEEEEEEAKTESKGMRSQGGGCRTTEDNNNSRVKSSDQVIHQLNHSDISDSKTVNHQPKKGTLWALPIVPKPPQKPPTDKNKVAGVGLAVLPPLVKVEACVPYTSSLMPSGMSANSLLPVTDKLGTNSTPNAAASTTATATAAAATGLDVWRQAFGVKKPAKKLAVPGMEEVRVSAGEKLKKKRTFLDIPPEVRRRPKPPFGGLIHFSPDWERAVRQHHEKCRLPKTLVNTIQVKPIILTSLSPSSQALQSNSSMCISPTPTSAAAAAAAATASPPPKCNPSARLSDWPNQKASPGLVGSPSFDWESPSESSENDSLHSSNLPSAGSALLNNAETPSQSSKSVVENILENRKKLRTSIGIGRMFRLPFIKIKKREVYKPFKKPESSNGVMLMPTPGYPSLTVEDNQGQEEHRIEAGEYSHQQPLGNFRRQTLLRYLDTLNVSAELKARILDWKPQIFETKTRRQSSQVKAETSYREIFGIDLPKHLHKKLSYNSQHSDASPSKYKKKKAEEAYNLSIDKATPTTASTSATATTTMTTTTTTTTTTMTNATPKVCSSPSVPADEASQKPLPSSCAVVSASHCSSTALPNKAKKTPIKAKAEEEPPAMPSTSMVVKRTLVCNAETKDKSEKASKKRPAAVSPETPAVPAKRGRKKKQVQVAEDEQCKQVTLSDQDLAFRGGGSCSGALAAAASLAEAAAIKAMEKEKGIVRKTPKKSRHKAAIDMTHPGSDSDDYTLTQAEQDLQKELQSFAQSLLDTHPSWERRKVIQNLVIWEFIPVDGSGVPNPMAAVSLQPFRCGGGTAGSAGDFLGTLTPHTPQLGRPPKRRGRKMRKRQSGLDFVKKKAAGKQQSSRDASRAVSPETDADDGEIVDVTHTLDHLIGDINRWVIDKSAGETILHRASKMGYPDAAAYALEMLNMNPMCKDYAGIPAIHKAAFKGHSEVVNMLLKYGSDPNTNVKGTRPLHEAIEGGNTLAVFHLLCYGSDPLLYDYSGNMPIDLAEDNEEMCLYLSNMLADLHGKAGQRWNVSYHPDYCVPEPGLEESPEQEQEEDQLLSTFEVYSRDPPPFYQFHDREGHFVMLHDLKQATPHVQVSKLEVLTLAKEDFLRSSHCCVLGARPSASALQQDTVGLIKVDHQVKRLLAQMVGR